jgi:hypothetical protein
MSTHRQTKNTSTLLVNKSLDIGACGWVCDTAFSQAGKVTLNATHSSIGEERCAECGTVCVLPNHVDRR